MSNQEAIALLRNLEDSLDSYCELNEEGKTAFRMAIEALSCSEFPNSSDTIYRQAAIAHAVPLNLFGREVMMVSVSELENLPSAQPELPEWAKKVEEYRQSAPQHIHNPLAWALYQVWKEIAADGGDKR